METLQWVCILLIFVSCCCLSPYPLVSAFPDGAPLAACATLTPAHARNRPRKDVPPAR